MITSGCDRSGPHRDEWHSERYVLVTTCHRQLKIPKQPQSIIWWSYFHDWTWEIKRETLRLKELDKTRRGGGNPPGVTPSARRAFNLEQVLWIFTSESCCPARSRAGNRHEVLLAFSRNRKARCEPRPPSCVPHRVRNCSGQTIRQGKTEVRLDFWLFDHIVLYKCINIKNTWAQKSLGLSASPLLGNKNSIGLPLVYRHFRTT